MIICLNLFTICLNAQKNIDGSPHDVNKSIVITVGNSTTLNPKTDMNIGSNFGNGGYQPNYDATGISVKTIDCYTAESKKYWAYEITGLRTGVFVFQAWMFTPDRSTAFVATYTITVVDVTSITIPSTLNVSIGDSYQFEPIITDSRATTTLSYKSSIPSIASITSDGVLTAETCGTTVVSCTAQNGVSASCTVIVNPVWVSDITLNYSEMELEENTKGKLIATVLPENATNSGVKWSSSNSNVVIVSQDGTITAISSGYANILATSTDGSDITASCLVHVVKPTVYAEEISISESSLDLSLGETYSLVVTISPNNVTSTEITWSSSNPSVATVDSKGKVMATGYGISVVTAKTSDGTNMSAECIVTVAKTEVLSLYDVFGRAGSTITLPVALTNKQSISGFDFSIVLPEGLTFGEAETTDRTEGMVASQNFVDGVYRFSVMSMSGGSVAGNDGVVLNIPLQIGSALENGEYPILIKDIVMFEVNGVDEYAGDDQTAILSLSDVLIGDVNGNDVVNTNDAIAIVNHVIGKPQASFIEAAADVNGNGVVNTNDAITIVNYVIGKTSTLGDK